MDNKINRVADDLDKWRKLEERLGATFSDLDKDKKFQIEKLNYLNSVASRYSETKDIGERAALVRLEKTRDKTEKNAYGTIGRFMRRIFRPARHKAAAKKEVVNYESDLRRVSGSIVAHGFGGLEFDLRSHVKPGQQVAEIPIIHDIRQGEKVGLLLRLERDKEGNLQFHSFKAQLSSEELGVNRQHVFGGQNGKMETLDNAINMLYGRAVHKQIQSFDGSTKEGWKLFDFDDKTPEGNYRVKTIQDYGLKDQLKQLPLKNQDFDFLDKLVKALIKGHRQEVTFSNNGNDRTFYLEANPRQENINIYDAQKNKTTLQEALKPKETQPIDLVKATGVKEVIDKSKTKEISANTETSTGGRRKNGVKVNS